MKNLTSQCVNLKRGKFLELKTIEGGYRWLGTKLVKADYDCLEIYWRCNSFFSSDFVNVRIKEVKKFVWLELTKCFAAISVFWILVKVFVNTWSPVLRSIHSSICKCCSDFITVIFEEPKNTLFHWNSSWSSVLLRSVFSGV